MIEGSLQLIVASGLLPPYSHVKHDDETMEVRSNATFSVKDIGKAKRMELPPPFDGDEEPWRNAFTMVEEFTAGHAARTTTSNWQLPRCLGPFVTMAPEIYQQLCFVVESKGLRRITQPNQLLRASFEATETLAVKKLPSFYGDYLRVWKNQQNPWDRSIDLRFQLDLAVEPNPRGAVASFAITAPAVSAIAAIKASMASFASPHGATKPDATHLLLKEIARRWGRPAPLP
jgi:hypothetical protein